VSDRPDRRVSSARCRFTSGSHGPTISAERGELLVAAALSFVATLVLGGRVCRLPPGRLDRAAARFYGRGVAPARFFTALGRTWVLVAISVVAAAASAIFGGSVVPIAALLASQVLAQGAVALLKSRFARARPSAWLVRLEAGRSFPSGHATTTIVFYVPLGLVVLHGAPHVLTDLIRGGPPAGSANVACATFVFACALGIPWSRVVLGAHFATDVAGGLLFGCGWTLATAALLRP
jgi:membrane-associated phospholipid phosphatase